MYILGGLAKRPADEGTSARQETARSIKRAVRTWRCERRRKGEGRKEGEVEEVNGEGYREGTGKRGGGSRAVREVRRRLGRAGAGNRQGRETEGGKARKGWRPPEAPTLLRLPPPAAPPRLVRLNGQRTVKNKPKY